jgi:hypothetical protein
MSQCLIKLENNHLGFYYSGQVVTGVVEVTLKKALSCKGEIILFENIALLLRMFFLSSSFVDDWESRF